LQQILLLDFEVIKWSQRKKEMDFYVELIVKYITKTASTASANWITVYDLYKWVINVPADLLDVNHNTDNYYSVIVN